MPDSRKAHKVHQWSFSVRRSLENVMMEHIDNLDLQNYLLVPSPSKAACSKVAREKLWQIDKQNWENVLVSIGRDETNGNKLRIYRTYKNALCTEYYVKHHMRPDRRSILARFRSCNLPLAIETGRFIKPKTPLNQRRKFVDFAKRQP